MYYVYRFINGTGKVIYVGRTENLKNRMNSHFGSSGHLPAECYESVERVDCLELKNRTDMKIKELYYIGKYRPEYNVKDNSECTVVIDELKDVWVTVGKNANHLITKNECVDCKELKVTSKALVNAAERIKLLEKCLQESEQNYSKLNREMVYKKAHLEYCMKELDKRPNTPINKQVAFDTAITVLKASENPCTAFTSKVEGEEWYRLYKDIKTGEILCEQFNNVFLSKENSICVMSSENKEREGKSIAGDVCLWALMAYGCNHWEEFILIPQIEVNIGI